MCVWEVGVGGEGYQTSIYSILCLECSHMQHPYYILLHSDRNESSYFGARGEFHDKFCGCGIHMNLALSAPYLSGNKLSKNTVKDETVPTVTTMESFKIKHFDHSLIFLPLSHFLPLALPLSVKVKLGKRENEW